MYGVFSMLRIDSCRILSAITKEKLYPVSDAHDWRMDVRCQLTDIDGSLQFLAYADVGAVGDCIYMDYQRQRMAHEGFLGGMDMFSDYFHVLPYIVFCLVVKERGGRYLPDFVIQVKL